MKINLFDVAKIYGNIISFELSVTQKIKIEKLIRERIDRGPWCIFPIVKTRDEYKHLNIENIISNKTFFTCDEKNKLYEGIYEAIPDNLKLYVTEPNVVPIIKSKQYINKKEE
ncbi:hypothetical protein DV013_004549, partial [Vibrio parahaemolyticus]|nr:hypothetical protein [Vibrio parahaemolyticus]